MRSQRAFEVCRSRRPLILGLAAVITLGALVPLLAQASRSGTGEVIAVRDPAWAGTCPA